MKLTLSENIRTLRKERKITQEKLAETLGVTVGAVYKWEAGLSVPELNLIVEMADFFDTSVDVLIGYKMKDNRLESVIERVTQYCQTLDPAALAEAEKALTKYPYSFRIVYYCAEVFIVFGLSSHDGKMLRRALALLEQAVVLLPQNRDPKISETVLYGEMAAVMILLKERESGLELLKKNNAGGMFSSEIGTCLAVYSDRPEEAVPYLSDGLLNGLSSLLTAAISYVFVYRSRNDWDSALAVITWAIDVLTGLKTDAQTDSLDRIYAGLLALLAYAQFRCGMEDASRDSLEKAAVTVKRFDSMPNYSLRAMRFAEHMDQTVAFDIYGAGAAEFVENLIGLLDDPPFMNRWKETAEHV